MPTSLASWLRLAAADVAGVEADVADVVGGGEPGEEAVEAEAVPAVGDGSVLALVSKPVVGRGVQPLLRIRRHQLCVVGDPHGAPHDLAHSGHQQVHTLRQRVVLRAPCHIC